jgi:hypothetical protein
VTTPDVIDWAKEGIAEHAISKIPKIIGNDLRIMNCCFSLLTGQLKKDTDAPKPKPGQTVVVIVTYTTAWWQYRFYLHSTGKARFGPH